MDSAARPAKNGACCAAERASIVREAEGGCKCYHRFYDEMTNDPSAYLLDMVNTVHRM